MIVRLGYIGSDHGETIAIGELPRVVGDLWDLDFGCIGWEGVRSAQLYSISILWSLLYGNN